jgi:DNA (cytosine-5)-methyltransferase 1
MTDALLLPKRQLRELHLFAGVGGGILGGMLLGHTCVCAVEIEPYCRNVLLQRQRDGILPRFPIWDDVRTFDGKPWRGLVDVVCGGFPCQDVSIIGKGAGISGERSGLWSEMARIIGEIQPPFAFVENSPMLVQRGLATVLSDLTQMGYDATWGIIGADDAGFPHHRARLWLVGNSRGAGLQRHSRDGQNSDQPGRVKAGKGGPTCAAGLRLAGWKRVVYVTDRNYQYTTVNGVLFGRPRTRFIEPGLGRVARGIPNRMDRIKAVGNSQVPAVVALAWETLSGGITQQ